MIALLLAVCQAQKFSRNTQAPFVLVGTTHYYEYYDCWRKVDLATGAVVSQSNNHETETNTIRSIVPAAALSRDGEFIIFLTGRYLTNDATDPSFEPALANNTLGVIRTADMTMAYNMSLHYNYQGYVRLIQAD